MKSQHQQTGRHSVIALCAFGQQLTAHTKLRKYKYISGRVLLVVALTLIATPRRLRNKYIA